MADFSIINLSVTTKAIRLQSLKHNLNYIKWNFHLKRNRKILHPNKVVKGRDFYDLLKNVPLKNSVHACTTTKMALEFNRLFWIFNNSAGQIILPFSDSKL